MFYIDTLVVVFFVASALTMATEGDRNVLEVFDVCNKFAYVMCTCLFYSHIDEILVSGIQSRPPRLSPTDRFSR